MTSPPPSTGTSLHAASPRHPRQDHLLKRSGTARLLTPLVGALALLWLLAGLTLYAAHQLHDVKAASATTQGRVVLLIGIRSLQRDALNLVSEDEPAELPVILRKFASRSRTMRADLRTLHRGAGDTLQPSYFGLSYRVLDALQAVARQVQRGDRDDVLRRFHRKVHPAERAASKVPTPRSSRSPPAPTRCAPTRIRSGCASVTG